MEMQRGAYRVDCVRRSSPGRGSGRLMVGRSGKPPPRRVPLVMAAK